MAYLCRDIEPSRRPGASRLWLSLPPSTEVATRQDARRRFLREASKLRSLGHDAARSLQLALEREALERANAEAASLRRSQRLQRDFLSRLNHELRTPLTAIQGYASTLRQPDVSWDTWSQQRFLDSIASESASCACSRGALAAWSRSAPGSVRDDADGHRL